MLLNRLKVHNKMQQKGLLLVVVKKVLKSVIKLHRQKEKWQVENHRKKKLKKLLNKIKLSQVRVTKEVSYKETKMLQHQQMVEDDKIFK